MDGRETNPRAARAVSKSRGKPAYCSPTCPPPSTTASRLFADGRPTLAFTLVSSGLRPLIRKFRWRPPMEKSAHRPRIETLAVHGGERRPGPHGSVVFPIYQGTVYTYEDGTGYHD